MASSEAQKRLAIDTHSQQVDRFDTWYQELEGNPYQNCFAYSRYRLDAKLDQYLPKDGTGLKLLDLGCGTGRYIDRLHKRGFEVVGVDGSLAMVDDARRNNPGVTVEQADVEDVPLPSASFDVILCIEVLRYLPNSQGTIREMARLLKPGGRCFVTAVPVLNLNAFFLVNRLAHRLPLGKLSALKQFFAWSPELRRQFVRAGFLPPEIHGLYLGPVNWIEHLVPKTLPAALRRWERADDMLADRPVLREFSNSFLVCAVRKPSPSA